MWTTYRGTWTPTKSDIDGYLNFFNQQPYRRIALNVWDANFNRPSESKEFGISYATRTKSTWLSDRAIPRRLDSKCCKELWWQHPIPASNSSQPNLVNKTENSSSYYVIKRRNTFRLPLLLQSYKEQNRKEKNTKLILNTSVQCVWRDVCYCLGICHAVNCLSGNCAVKEFFCSELLSGNFPSLKFCRGIFLDAILLKLQTLIWNQVT